MVARAGQFTKHTGFVSESLHGATLVNDDTTISATAKLLAHCRGVATRKCACQLGLPTEVPCLVRKNLLRLMRYCKFKGTKTTRAERG